MRVRNLAILAVAMAALGACQTMNNGSGNWHQVKDGAITSADGKAVKISPDKALGYPINAVCKQTTSTMSGKTLQWVQAGPECLLARLETQATDKEKTLVIFIHGDTSRGGAASYWGYAVDRYIEQSSYPVSAAYVLRPGYYAGGRDGVEKLYSSGWDYGRGDTHPPYVTDVLAEAARELKKESGATRAVCVGHSGGADVCASITAVHNDVFDGALLISCPCDYAAYRAYRGRGGSSYRSQSPIDVADQMLSTKKIIAATGRSDTNTAPKLAQGYITYLKSRGIDAEFHFLDMGHNVRFSRSWGSIKALLDRLVSKVGSSPLAQK